MWVSFSGHNGPELLDISGMHLFIHAYLGSGDAIVDPDAHYEVLARLPGTRSDIALHRGQDFTVAENVLLRIQAGLSTGAKLVKIHS